MDSLELKRVKAIFSVAVEQSGADRETFIEQACGNDLKLRAEVNAYLIAADEAGDGLNSPTRPSPPAARLPDSRSRQILGSFIGNYKLIELIGEGGFGSVYMAEQQRPVLRQVALKIIKLGMDTQRVIDRFEAERQSLAIMDHPNIARVFDAGATESGRPYFVMELVQGVLITEHCDAGRLNTSRRLELFIIVCNAIQHAHAKGVIHRDIKPSNVLVTLHDGVAIPKVIDFGIAKATQASATERTAFTDESQFIGTPAYMSPEQADTSGLDVDTRSDIYSLGVLLYELLTGTTPFDRKRLLSAPHDEVQRILRDVDPPKPSTRLNGLGEPLDQVAANRSANPLKLRQLIRGELDWIVMKAIAKDRARRYETAHELARDIRRYLNREPVEACPPSAGYRFRTFVRRHHKAVSTTIGFVITVAISIGVYIHGMRREQRNTAAALRESQHQRDEADRRRNEAQQATIRALAAETQANHELVTAALTQAHGAQASARSGRRFNSLSTLAAAARIKVNAEMRSQAISCLGVPDMRIARQWAGRDRAVCFDHSCTLYADCTSDRRILIRRIPDASNPQGTTIIQLPGHARMDSALPRAGGACVAFSPDDRQVAAGFDDGHIRVFTLDGALVFDIAGGPGFDFNPDGASIATSAPNQPTAIYDLKTGKKLCQLAWASFDSVCFSPNGRKLAMWNAGHSEDVFIGEIDTGRVMQLAHHAIVWGVAWHPSSILFATAGDDRGIRLWNVAQYDPKLVAFMDGHAARVTSISFTHGGDLLASASEDGSIGLWDPYLKAQLMRVFCTGTLHLSNDDRLLGVVAPDGGHTLIEVADGLELRSIYAPSANRERVVFSQDGSLMACEGGRLLRFWDLTAPGLNETRADLKFANTVRSVAFHPDGTSLIINTDGALSRISIREQPPQLNGLGKNPVRQIQIGDRAEQLLSRTPKDDGAADMSADGSHLALAPLGQDAVVLDLRSPSAPLTLASSADTSFIAISPDGRWVATGTAKGDGNHLRIWDATTGQVICSLPLFADANVAFSPDNHWLATVTADELRFWEVGSWRPRQGCALKSSLSGHIFFTADSRLAAIPSHQMGVALVDVAGAAELATLQDEWDERPMGFSPDGSLLVTKGPHTTLRLWDLRRIRAELGPMGLDWNEPPLPPRKIQKRIILTTTRPSPTTLPD